MIKCKDCKLYPKECYEWDKDLRELHSDKLLITKDYEHSCDEFEPKKERV